MSNSKAEVGKSPSLLSHEQPLATPETDVSITVSEDAVRVHAYELYKHRGCSQDNAVEDWLTAEAHLLARKNRANKKLAR
jgi:DUF2934 family protein